MFPIKSFGYSDSRSINTTVFQQLLIPSVNAQPGLVQTINWKTPFTGNVPTVIITVQSSDGTLYSSTIVSLSRFFLTYTVFPVYISYPKYRYYRFAFTKTISTNFDVLNPKLAIGRLKLYNHTNRQISATTFAISSNQPPILPGDVQSLVNPLPDVTLSFVANIPSSTDPLQINVTFAVPTSVSAYEIISQTYPNNTTCLFSNQPSSWNVLASNDNSTFFQIQAIDRFHTVATCSESISSFQLPPPTSFNPVDIHIIGTNAV